MIEKLKQRKYIALLFIAVLVVGIISLVSFGRPDKYAGLVKVKNTNVSTKLLSSTGVLLDSENVLGNSTAEYTVSFTLEPIDGVTSRTAVVKGTLSDEEAKYARFKRVEGTGITSTLSDNGKSIQVEIEDTPLGIEKSIKLRVIIENAPNSFTVKPNIYVQEKTSEDKKLDTPEIVVTTNTIVGIVKDSNNLPVGNIEIVAKSNGREVKRTYTDENGNYTITDLSVGNYEIDIDEEVYEIAEKKVIDVEGTTNVDIKVKAIEPYTIETHKYIEKLDLVIDGEEKHYTYDDAEEVLETIRKANNISGKIEYKLIVKNTGSKTGTVTRVEDEASEGLKLNLEENIGWEEVDGIYYYRPIEGSDLQKGETREIGLVLEIESTNAAKTYVNKMTAKGELYEKVVFILDGEKYKETSVLEGEKLDEVIISDDNFSGWYTDSNLSNKYNFNLPVRKDMILYGEINKPICTVTFMDFGNIYDRQEIICGSKAVKPSDPVHEGYNFDKWIDEDEYEFDPNEPIERDVTYYSKNDLIVYRIEYEGLTNEEETQLNNPTEYTIVSDNITISNPNNRVDIDGDPSEAFVGWTTETNPSPDMAITIPTGSTGDKKFIANWTPIAPDEYTITYYLYGGELEQGKTNRDHYNKTTETFTLNNPSKLGYDFIGWTGTDLTSETITVTIPTGSRGDRVYYANYEPTKYRITYNLDGGALPEGSSNPDEYTIESAPITLINPTKEGHQFTGWTGTDLVGKNTQVVIPTGSTGDREYTATYEKNKYTVIFMDGESQFAKQTVLHGDLATLPDSSPSKTHNIFLGWTLDGTIYDFNTPVTHDITLYSSYEEVLPPTITHTPDLPEWTNQFVTVTVTSDHSDYSYVYHVENNSNENYSTPFQVDENGRVYAYSVKSGVSSVEVYHDITNIDKIKPEIKTLDLAYATRNEAKIDFTAIDGQSGLKEIKIYKKLSTDADYTYITSVNYNRETTTLQSEEYVFNNLTDGTTYDVKLVAYDYAGNISEESELEFTTTAAPVIVARIITVGNSPLNEEEYIYLPSLRAGIEYNEDGINCLTTQCTIQMLKSVNETNDILGGQDITLDLNGQTVNGVGEYTIRVNNGASFKLIDDADFDEENYNELNHNSLKNDIDKAIINNGILTLGEGRTGEDISVYVPLVRGKNTGIDTVNGTFNFYDGRIIGTTAISGEVDDAPDMYTANVEIKTQDEETIQVATLQQVADVEARIGTKYYTRVATAVEEAKNGRYVDVLETKEFMDSFDKTGTYGFIKDGNFLVNENTTKSTTAQSGFVLDLTNSDENQVLTIATNKLINSSSLSNYSNSIIEVYTGTDKSGTRVLNYGVPVGETTKEVVLPKGNKYYIDLYHSIYNSENYPEECKFYITSLTLRDYEQENPSPYADMETTDVSTNYGFDYDPVTKSYKSNNQYTSNTTAFSYYEIDLTNETNNKLLIINATLSNNGSHYGYIYAKTDNNKETNYSSSNVMLSIINSGNQNYGPVTATKELQAGQKYYVQFYYQKNYDSYNQAAYESMGVKDQFIINSMDLVDTSIISENSIDLSTNLVTPGDYGFTANTTVYANSTETVHSYVTVDLTNTSTETYAELDFNSYYRFYTVVTDSPTLPTDYSNSVYHNPIEGPNYYGPVTFDLEPNKVNYIHFIMPPAPTGNTMLKSLKICNGKSYDVVNDFKKSKGADYGMDNYRMSYPIALASAGTPADAYTEIDLRNSSSDVLLSVDAILASSYLSYMYVSENDVAVNPSDLYDSQKYDLTQNLLFKLNGSSGYIVMNGDSNGYKYNTNTYNFVLSKGKKYYLHFGGLNTNYYINKVVTRNISSYDLKIGKSNFVDKTQVSYEEIVVDEDDESLRFVGANPNNYVSFNNETWRIVGVFNTEDENGVTKPRIKLIKEGDIGSFSYDTSITDNNATGVNEWSESDVMKLLNPGYSNNEEELFSLVTPPSTQTKYSHTANIDDEMNVNGQYAANIATKDVVTIPGATKLHVELRYGTENNYDKVYIFKGEYTGTISSSTTGYYTYYTGGNNNSRYSSFDIEGDTVTFGFFSDFSVTGWGYHAIVTDAYDPVMTSQGVKTVNNSLYWDKANGRCFNNSNNRASSCYFSGSGMDNAYKDYIDTVVWHTGAIPDSISGLSASEILAYERGSATGKTDYTSQGAVDDSVTRTSTWTGKVGLPSPSDYLYASTWIRNGSGAWFINPVYNSTLDKISYGNSSSVGYDSASYNYAIRPTVYLSTKTIIASGDGSSSNPYVLSLGQTDNPDMNDYYGLNPEEEEEDTGTVIYDETTDYQNIKDDIIYGFDYNEEYGYYQNNNAGQLSSTAATYLEIDMTGELSSASAELRAFAPNSLGSGIIVITEDEFDSNINLNDYSSYSRYKYYNVNSPTHITDLITFEPGKKYYFYMLFKTDSSNYGSVMVVYLNGLADTIPTSIVTKYEGEAIEFNTDVDTIQILKDISAPQGLVIEETKDVILDLNGHTLTTSSTSPVITNNGRLTVIDSKTNGAITSANNSTITNNENAYLNVTDGDINNNKNSAKVIDNSGSITLGADATVNVLGTRSYGIYNRASGDILDGLGTINNPRVYTPTSNDSGTSIYTLSTVDTGFTGYTMTSLYDSSTADHTILNITVNSIYDTSSATHSYNNISGTDTIFEYSGKGVLTIAGSSFSNINLGYGRPATHIVAPDVNTIINLNNVEANNINFGALKYYNGGTSQAYNQVNRGTLNISNGSNIGTFTGVNGNYNLSSSNVDTISVSSPDGTFVMNDSTSGNVTMLSNATITDSNFGRTNNEAGSNLTIKGDSEVSNKISNMGTLTIGEDDGTVSTVYPKVTSTTAPTIYSYDGGIFNFYDGSLTGQTNNVISGSIKDIPDNVDIVSTINGDNETITLGENGVAEVGGTTYGTLQAAVDSITTTEETEITIVKDFSMASTVIIPSNKNIKINYAGHTIKIYSDSWLENSGTVNLYDSENTTLNNHFMGSKFITNEGTIVYNVKSDADQSIVVNNSGTMSTESNSSFDDVSFTNSGQLSINGGVLKGSLTNSGTLDITGGLSSLVVTNQSTGVINMSGGTFNSSEYYRFTNNGTLNITGGTFNILASSLSYLVLNNSTGTVNITGGTYQSGFNLVYNSGTATIKNITGNFSKVIENYKTAVIEGVTITASSNGQYSYIITSTNNLTIKDSTITGLTSVNRDLTIENSTLTNNNYTPLNISDIGTYSSNVTIKSGEIKSNYSTAITNSGSGTITFGVKGGGVSTTSPKITGYKYAFRNTNTNSSVYFYDGIFTGQNNYSVDSNITDVEPGYDIITADNGNNTESQFLSAEILVRNINIPKDYVTLQEAIDEATSGDELQMLRHLVTTSGYESTVIPANKTIILDLNGKNIIQNGVNGPLITNNGTLIINDVQNSESVITNNTSNSTIVNNGSLSTTFLTINSITANTNYMISNSSGAVADIVNLTYTNQTNVAGIINNEGTMSLEAYSIYGLSDDTTPTIINSGTLTMGSGSVRHRSGSGSTLISNTGTLTTTSISNQGYINNTGTYNMNSTSVTNGIKSSTGTTNMNNGIVQLYEVKLTGDAIFNMNDGTISSGISTAGTSQLIIKDGIINNGITASSSNPLTIGVKDGTIDATTPVINANSYDSYAISGTSGINFYDGIVKNSNSDYNPISNPISDIETNSSIVIENKSEYLITDAIIKNTTTGVSYNEVSDAINAASNNDNLELLHSCLATSGTVTIPSSKTITLDMKDKNLYSDSQFKIVNNGTFNITSTTLNASNFIKNSGNMIENSGTLRVDNVVIMGLITNSGTFNENSGSLKASVTNSGTFNIGTVDIYVVSSIGTTKITNTGTFKISNGNLRTNDYVVSPTIFDNSSTGTMTIEYMTTNLSSTVVGPAFINNAGNLEIKDGNYNMMSSGYSGYESQAWIKNTGTVNILGGTFECNSSPRYVTLVYNYSGSTATIKNITAGVGTVGANYGTMTVDNLTTTKTSGLVTYNKLYFRNSTVDDFTLDYEYNVFKQTYRGEGEVDNVTITNGTITLAKVTVRDSNLSTTNSTINMNGGLLADPNNDSYTSYLYNSHLSSSGANAVTLDTKLIIDGSSSITSSNGIGLVNKGVVILGAKDGNYESTGPTITGSTYGVDNRSSFSSDRSTLSFYDGNINGGTNAISGTVTDVETGYVVDLNYHDSIYTATLKIPGQNERVIVFNNINYTSLQAAIDASVSGVTNEMVLYTDYTLTSDVNIPASRTIKLYLNGHTLNNDVYNINVPSGSSFTTESGTPTGWTGSISGVGASNGKKDIIVYQMSDGNELSVEETYKLYKFIDNSYKIVTVSENNIGDYLVGGSIEKMNTIRGRIYLSGVEQGSYKLVSNKGREIDFDINEDNISNNIRLNNNISGTGRESSSVATVILTFATGILRTPWMIFILIALALIVTAIIAIKKKDKNKEVI